MTTTKPLTKTQRNLMLRLDGRLSYTRLPARQHRTVIALVERRYIRASRLWDEAGRTYVWEVCLTKAGSDLCYYGHLDY